MSGDPLSKQLLCGLSLEGKGNLFQPSSPSSLLQPASLAASPQSDAAHQQRGPEHCKARKLADNTATGFSNGCGLSHIPCRRWCGEAQDSGLWRWHAMAASPRQTAQDTRWDMTDSLVLIHLRAETYSAVHSQMQPQSHVCAYSMCVCVSVCFIRLTQHTDRGLARVRSKNVCVCVCVCTGLPLQGPPDVPQTRLTQLARMFGYDLTVSVPPALHLSSLKPEVSANALHTRIACSSCVCV